MTNKKSFYVTLPSNASLQYFPENKLNDFTIVMNPHIELDNKLFEVALVNINFENDFILNSDHSRRFEWHNKLEEKPRLLHIAKQNYHTIYDIVSALNEQIAKIDLSVTKEKNKISNPIYFVVNEKNRRVYMRLNEDLNTLTTQTIYFSKELSDILGFQFDQEYTLSDIEGSDIEIWSLKPYRLFVRPCFIRVLCDIIEEEYFNESKMKLLRQLTLSEPEHTYANIAPNILFYKKVIINNIPQIHIQLVDEHNTPLHIVGGQTILTIHFREV
jgi:hypothetical protein